MRKGPADPPRSRHLAGSLRITWLVAMIARRMAEHPDRTVAVTDPGARHARSDGTLRSGLAVSGRSRWPPSSTLMATSGQIAMAASTDCRPVGGGDPAWVLATADVRFSEGPRQSRRCDRVLCRPRNAWSSALSSCGRGRQAPYAGYSRDRRGIGTSRSASRSAGIPRPRLVGGVTRTLRQVVTAGANGWRLVPMTSVDGRSLRPLNLGG
jgi:hypothetical protein